MTWGSGSTYSYYDHVVILDNVSDYNTINACQIIGPNRSLGTFNGAVIWSGYNSSYSYTQDQYNTISNNYMKNSSTGIYWIGNWTGSGAEVGNVFNGNVLDSNQNYGIFCQVQDSIIITNNKINMPYGNYGIYFYYVSGFSYYGNSYHNLIANNFISVGKKGSPYTNAVLLL